MIHRSDRLEEIVAHLVRLGWGDVTVKRLPPAARVLVRARRGEALARRRHRRRSCLHRPEGGYTDEAEADPASRRAACLLGGAPRQCRPC